MLKTGSKRYISLVGSLLLMAVYPLIAQATLQWTERNPNAGATGQPDFTQVIYAAGHYVAVGDGTIMESADGVSWTEVYHHSGLGYGSAEVAYGSGIFVAGFGILVDDGLGENITVEKGSWATSEDGVNWTATAPHDPPASELIFADGQFAMVGTICGENQGRQIQPGETFLCLPTDIETSSDGVTWTSYAPTAGGVSYLPYNLSFANGLFISFSPSGVNTDTAYVSSDAVHWDAVATLGMNVAGFNLGRMRVIGNTVRAFSDKSYPEIASTQDAHTWHMVAYLSKISSQHSQTSNHGHFDDMVSYGNQLLALVVSGIEFSANAGYSMWLGSNDKQQWCELDGYPASTQGVAMAVHGGQVVVVGGDGEIFSTAPSANAESLSCDSGGYRFPAYLTGDSVPVSSGGRGDLDLLLLCALLGLVLRRRGGARCPA